MTYNKNMGNTVKGVEHAASNVFHGVENTVDSVAKAIGSLPSTAEHIITHTEDSVTKIVTNGENQIGSTVKGAEMTLLLPLAAIGIGLAIMMGRSNSSTIENLGSQAINRI